MPTRLTQLEVLALIQRRIDKAGTLTALAAEWGTSVAYLSDIMRGRRDPGPKILQHFGLSARRAKPVITYEKIP